MEDPTERATAPQLWVAHPDDLLDRGVEHACAAVLNEEERIRAARFRFDRHRREYIATHTLLRIALAHNHQSVTKALLFRFNAHGKPALEPDCGVHFNLSHCESLAVCLLARGAEVGVDVEPLECSDKVVSMASRVFSSVEQAQFDLLQAEARLDRALSLWVLKEAYIKARGLGLALPLRNIAFLFGGAEGIRLETEVSVDKDAARWRFCMVDYAGHRVAAVVESLSADPELEVWEARLPKGEPKMIGVLAEGWFPRGHAHQQALGSHC